MSRLFSILLAYLFFLTISCQKGAGPEPVKPLFDSIPTTVLLQPVINEVSGIADSKTNPGYLWAEEDGGNPAQLYLIKHNGAVQKQVFLNGVTNRDWEDMVLSGTDLYVGDIGDNNAVYTDYVFYKFPEPPSSVDTVKNIETIRFRYPDGAHDAEAFVVDPSTKAIYIITKRENPSRIYKLSPSFSRGINVAQNVGQLLYGGVVSAAISADGKEMILKTYFGLNYYKISTNESIEAALIKPATSLPYTIEPQGEAVCFSASGNGYFTLSEKAAGATVSLYFYKRN